MKWLLLILIFDVSNGGMRVIHQESRVFRSESACNSAGQALERTVRYPGENVRSMSICIPESAFEE